MLSMTLTGRIAVNRVQLLTNALVTAEELLALRERQIVLMRQLVAALKQERAREERK
jgi:hypothetical protein